MGRRIRWPVILALMFCVICGSACAQSGYQELCVRHGLYSADAIAWLEIPGASICEPVMRHAEDNAYYVKRAPDGKENAFGAVYVQPKYNADDFSDPVTLVYGSSTREEAPFGRLQQLYSGSFEQCRTLYLHMPEETCEYRVFAAIPYSSIHILHYYDFTSERRFADFFEAVRLTRRLGMHMDAASFPSFGEPVLILSTGLRGEEKERYLVLAVKVTM